MRLPGWRLRRRILLLVVEWRMGRGGIFVVFWRESVLCLGFELYVWEVVGLRLQGRMACHFLQDRLQGFLLLGLVDLERMLNVFRPVVLRRVLLLDL